MNINQAKKACRNYLAARKKFLEFANKNELLNGNDNIIGSRIGEFIAWQFLSSQKRYPVINNQSNVKDYDIICKDKARVSVKLISPENKIGRTTRLGDDWDEFILIILGDNYRVEKLGQLTRNQFIEALQNNVIGQNPYVSRSMVNNKGLFSKYGKIFQGKDIKNLI